MATPNDILLGLDFDLSFEGGSFAVGDATRQNQQFLLLTNKGEQKQHPTIGVGIRGFLNTESSVSQIKTAIQSEFERDGMKVNKLDIKPDFEFEIEAPYK